MHLYIVVACKSDDCMAVHVLRHLGEKGKAPARVEYWMPFPLTIDCPQCGRSYDYAYSDHDFRQKELPAPPAGYFDRLPAAPISSSSVS